MIGTQLPQTRILNEECTNPGVETLFCLKIHQEKVCEGLEAERRAMNQKIQEYSIQLDCILNIRIPRLTGPTLHYKLTTKKDHYQGDTRHSLLDTKLQTDDSFTLNEARSL